MSNQSLKQASVRAVTGTSGTYEEDWNALFTLAGVQAGVFNERLPQRRFAALGRCGDGRETGRCDQGAEQ